MNFQPSWDVVLSSAVNGSAKLSIICYSVCCCDAWYTETLSLGPIRLMFARGLRASVGLAELEDVKKSVHSLNAKSV